jgi:hypothetical protein
MKRSQTEIKLLTLRQKLKSAIDSVKARKVIDFYLFEKLSIRYQTCNEMIEIYRMEKANANPQESIKKSS